METNQEQHKYFAGICFNQCWTLIDKPDRTSDEIVQMILLTNASLWHWTQRTDCTPINLSIGYWQAVRVYALAEQYEMAKLFGEKCLAVGQTNQLAPFYIGYAYEALARAEFLAGNHTQCNELLHAAEQACAAVDDDDDQAVLRADLDGLRQIIA